MWLFTPGHYLVWHLVMSSIKRTWCFRITITGQPIPDAQTGASIFPPGAKDEKILKIYAYATQCNAFKSSKLITISHRANCTRANGSKGNYCAHEPVVELCRSITATPFSVTCLSAHSASPNTSLSGAVKSNYGQITHRHNSESAT